MAPPTPWVLGGGISMMKNIFAEQQLRQGEFWIAFSNVSHPVAARPANHPNYFLLGFIAALAPKFHPAGCFPTVIGTPMLLAAGWLLAAAGCWPLARRAQEIPGEPRRAEESPGQLRGAQESPGEPRRAQRTQGAQAAQGSPGDARSPGAQESPGEPRRTI
jgi:hypothetical protein